MVAANSMCPWRNRITNEDRKHYAAGAGQTWVPRVAHSRRDFCRAAGALALATAADRPFSLASLANGFSEDIPAKFDVVAIDRVRVLAAAQCYLKEPPITITAFTSERSPGGKHDYFSEADYFWPDPKNPHGPYIPLSGTADIHARLALRVGHYASTAIKQQHKRYGVSLNIH